MLEGSHGVVRGRLALVAAFVALAGACGGADDEPQQAGESNGLIVYEVASQDFSISTPAKWRVVSVDEALPKDERERLGRENPDLARVFDQIGSDNGPIKLLAFDPTVRDAFATNMNVVALDLPSGTTLDEFVAANKAEIQSFGGRASSVASERAQLPSGPAHRLSYRPRLTLGDRARSLATLEYLLTGGGKGYVVTFSTLPDQSERYALFDRVIRSLRLD